MGISDYKQTRLRLRFALCVDAQIYHSKLYVLFSVPTVLLRTTFNVLHTVCNIFRLYHNVLICKHFDIISWLMLHNAVCERI